jgi:holo-ACP synthase CitX
MNNLEILKNKEKNFNFLLSLLSTYEAIITLNLNIPNFIKLEEKTINKLYKNSINILISNFEFDYILIDKDREIRYFCFKKSTNDENIKKQLVKLEEEKKENRLYDFDLYSSKKDIPLITRSNLKLNMRGCYVCGENSIICRRKKKHTKTELKEAVLKLISNNPEKSFEEFSSKIASFGVAASIYETLIHPKPGLVDPIDSGIHEDMNIFTFARSSSILWPYLYKCSFIGKNWKDNLELLYSNLKPIGLECEKKMEEVTSGINTHKGLIFIFGLIAASAGFLHGKNIDYSIDKLTDIISKMTKGIVKKELKIKNKKNTKGEIIYNNYEIAGIRGEAETGFETSKLIFNKLFNKKIDDKNINKKGLNALFELLTKIDDTNIIFKDKKYMEKTKEISKKILEKWENKEIPELESINNFFKEKKISPGGAGDLLATIFYFYFLENK